MGTLSIDCDVQSSGDNRNVPINWVGIDALRLPLKFEHHNDNNDQINQGNLSLARWSAYADLAATERGTHMSRIVHELQQVAAAFSFTKLCALPEKLTATLNSHYAACSLDFSMIREVFTPVSKLPTCIDADIRIINCNSTLEQQILTISLPVKTLCPCSKGISDYGAHNQRSLVSVSIPCSAIDFSLIEKICQLIEKSASAPIFALLKRADEKYITELAYDNPKFVEDLVRDCTLQIQQLYSDYRIVVVNYESIHNHNARAVVETKNFPVHSFL